MKTVAAVIALTFVFALTFTLSAQDPRWLKMWERAQEDRPGTIGAVTRIAPESEPGIPLVLHGKVYDRDGVKVLPGVIVFAYQTDRDGLYHEPGAADWRLRGWARTDANGRFQFTTIRPGSYPNSRNPAHVHFTIERPDGLLHGEMQFGDDPLLTRRARKKAESPERFDPVRRVAVRDGVQHVRVNLRITNDGLF